MSCGGVLYVVRQTFIELPHTDENESHHLRRNKSEPCLRVGTGFVECSEHFAPTKCAYMNGEEIDDRSTSCGSSTTGDDVDVPSVSDDSSSISDLLPETANWADITELELGEETKEKSQSPCDKEIEEASKKPARRSGRTRQREKRRRQLRTPSPEMRNPWCECFKPRILPQLY